MAEFSHYDKVLNVLGSGKDSVFEPCKIMGFDKKKLTADVFFVSSHQRRDSVVVAFPSLFLNSGIFSPPAIGTTALAFWGPDREPIVIPAQFMMPSRGLENGTLVTDASPRQVDEVFDLSNIDLGELMFRSNGGSYIFLKNIGDVEIGTSKTHQISLVESDGSFNTRIERINILSSGFNYYNGPMKDENGNDTSDHYINIEISDSVPGLDDTDLDDKEIVQGILDGDFDILKKNAAEPIFRIQMGNVFNGFIKEVDENDGSELFFKAELLDNEDKGIDTKVTMTKNGKFAINTNSSISLAANGTEIEIGENGDIQMTISNKKYSVQDIVNRLNELSALNGLSEI